MDTKLKMIDIGCKGQEPSTIQIKCEKCKEKDKYIDKGA